MSETTLEARVERLEAMTKVTESAHSVDAGERRIDVALREAVACRLGDFLFSHVNFKARVTDAVVAIAKDEFSKLDPAIQAAAERPGIHEEGIEACKKAVQAAEARVLKAIEAA